MGRLVLKDGKLVEEKQENLQQANIQQPIPEEILQQMRQETARNKQMMEEQRQQAMSMPEGSNHFPFHPMEEEAEALKQYPTEEEIEAMRQQQEQEIAEEEPEQEYIPPQIVGVTIVMIGGLPMTLSIPLEYFQKFFAEFNMAIDRQLHFEVGTQVIVTKNILYYTFG